jgi:hypothetical protein
MSWRAGFLVIVAVVVLHLSDWQAGFVIGGYFGFARLDEWLANRARAKAIDEELNGWTPDAEDSQFESKGNWSRMRLSQNEQIVVTRVAELLRKIR